MELINLEKIPEKLREIVKNFIQDFFTHYPKKIISVNIYGSLARGDYKPGVSDINTAFVLEDTSFSSLRQIIKVLAKYRKKKFTVPLLFTSEYIQKSLDSFPLEFLELKENYILIYGEDIFSALEIDSSNLRLQVEQILKGRLLRIRQWYLEKGLSKKELRKVLEFGLKDVFPALRNLVRLTKGEVPKTRDEVLKALEEVLNLNLNFVNQIWEGNYVENNEWYLENFLSLLKKASEVVDEI
jgi:predicted nucleotidyltransferase